MLGFDFFLCVYLGFNFFVFFNVSLGYFVLVLPAVVVLGLVSSVRYIANSLARKNVSKMIYFV